MIVVSGATGKLGALVVEGLLEHVPAEQVGVSVRAPEKAAHLAARGVRVRRGDFAEPATLADAFEDAAQVLLVSVNAIGPEKVVQHRAAVDAAYAAGAKRVLYTSHQGSGADSLFAPMVDHAATETYLTGLGTPFTALRNGYYADTIPLLFGQALETGELVAPADGPVSWTAHADLAEAAVRVLTDEGRFDGPTPPLTAPEVFDLEQAAAILGELGGRTIRRVVVDDEEWRAGLVAQGSPEARVTMLLGMFQASRRGEFAVTGPALEELLGRPATPLRAVLAARL
ncbi:NAD(P)H-binding protein [Actinophytocola sp. NPDC049390]|uniref:NAD(P)H-binding protein n=1 Tax=Actinophytocola sp. NPDC049390 TaxID=3363894 RepID=UPI0037B43400